MKGVPWDEGFGERRGEEARWKVQRETTRVSVYSTSLVNTQSQGNDRGEEEVGEDRRKEADIYTYMKKNVYSVIDIRVTYSYHVHAVMSVIMLHILKFPCTHMVIIYIIDTQSTTLYIQVTAPCALKLNKDLCN